MSWFVFVFVCVCMCLLYCVTFKYDISALNCCCIKRTIMQIHRVAAQMC